MPAMPRASHTHLFSRPRNTLWRRTFAWDPLSPSPTSVKDREAPAPPSSSPLRQGTRPRVAQGPLCCLWDGGPGEACIHPSVLCLLVLVWVCRTPASLSGFTKSKLGLFTAGRG